MKKKVTNVRTNKKFVNIKRKVTLTLTTQSLISCNSVQGIESQGNVKQEKEQKINNKV